MGKPCRDPRWEAGGKHQSGNILGTPVPIGTRGHSPGDIPIGQGRQCQCGGRGTGNMQSMQPLKVTGYKDVWNHRRTLGDMQGCWGRTGPPCHEDREDKDMGRAGTGLRGGPAGRGCSEKSQGVIWGSGG